MLTLEEMVNAYQRVYDKRYVVRSDDKLVPDRAVGCITWGKPSCVNVSMPSRPTSGSATQRRTCALRFIYSP